MTRPAASLVALLPLLLLAAPTQTAGAAPKASAAGSAPKAGAAKAKPATTPAADAPPPAGPKAQPTADGPRTIAPLTPARRGVLQREVDEALTLTELLPPHSLPTEDVPAPMHYRLRYAGLDGADPATHRVWVATIVGDIGGLRATGAVMPKTAPVRRAAALGAAAEDPRALWTTKPGSQALLVSGVVPDGPDADAELARLEQLVTIAITLANAEPTSLLNVRAILRHVAEQQGIAAGAWTDTYVGDQALHAAYATPAEHHGGVAYKIAVPHQVGPTAVRLLLDVPSILPPRARIDLEVSHLDLSKRLDDPDWEFMVRLRACIKSECHEVVLPPGQTRDATLEIRRGVVAGPADVRLEAEAARRLRKGTRRISDKQWPCGDGHTYPCAWRADPKSHEVEWLAIDLDAPSGAHAAEVSIVAREAAVDQTRTFLGEKAVRVRLRVKAVPTAGTSK